MNELRIPEMHCECGAAMRIIEQDHKKNGSILIKQECSCGLKGTLIIDPDKSYNWYVKDSEGQIKIFDNGVF